MGNIKDRLKAFAKAQDLSVRQVERRAGLSNGFIASTTAGINSEKLRQISKAFPALNTDWLLTGEGEMIKPTTMIEQNNVNGNNEATVHHNDGEISNVRLENEILKLEIKHLRERLQMFEELYNRLLESVLQRK